MIAATLTPKQRDTMTELRRFMLKRCYPPTMRELGILLGGISAGGVQYRFKALVKKGYIEFDPGTARGIRILKES